MVSHSGPVSSLKLKLIAGHGNAGVCLLCDLLGTRLKANSKGPVSPTEICNHLTRMVLSLSSQCH